MRNINEIAEAENEFVDRVWYDRKEVMYDNIIKGKEEMPPEYIMDGLPESMQRVEFKYGKQNLGPYTEFEWGMINGKLSALRWVMGEDWDMLDT
jgi:hypothetical protein